MLVWGIFLKTDFLPFFDQVGQRIPPPQGYNFEAHCNELRSRGGWRTENGIERRVSIIGNGYQLLGSSMPGQSWCS